jgi:hypothetical protein
MRLCARCAALGVGFCLCAIATAEVVEFERPAQVKCEETPQVVDLGPPHGCDHVPGQHQMRVYAQPVTSSSAVGVSMGVISVVDLDHACRVEPWRPTSVDGSSAGPSADTVERNDANEAVRRVLLAWTLLRKDATSS